MTPTLDRRSTPATERVALEKLRGVLSRPDYTPGRVAQVAAPLIDLNAAPDGARDRQLLMGAEVTVIDTANGWSFIEDSNLYCGWVRSEHLADPVAITHQVANPATQIYATADFKKPALADLSLGARVSVTDMDKDWAQLSDGRFIPAAHLASKPQPDAAATALLLLGTPYVWGGNSRNGIDCSGLVQLSLNRAGKRCPGDSDQQQQMGTGVNGDIKRGDLLFWPGHVAMALDADTMIHATAYGMAVITEPISVARKRIEANPDSPLVAIRRP